MAIILHKWHQQNLLELVTPSSWSPFSPWFPAPDHLELSFYLTAHCLVLFHPTCWVLLNEWPWNEGGSLAPSGTTYLPLWSLPVLQHCIALRRWRFSVCSSSPKLDHHCPPDISARTSDSRCKFVQGRTLAFAPPETAILPVYLPLTSHRLGFLLGSSFLSIIQTVNKSQGHCSPEPAHLSPRPHPHGGATTTPCLNYYSGLLTCSPCFSHLQKQGFSH